MTQNGFTGSRNNRAVPEFKFDDRFPPSDGAELYQVIDGHEKLVGIFDFEIERFVPATTQK